MTTAVELAQIVYQRVNFDQTITSFSTTQDFPYNIAKELLNAAIDDLNERGRYRFMLTSTALAYAADVYQYALSEQSTPIDPEGLTKVELTAEGFQCELMSVGLERFRQLYRRSEVLTTIPTAWTDYGDTLELNVIPDQDYEISVWHYPIITRVDATTDTIAIPVRHEHVLKDMMRAYLIDAIGIGDFASTYALADKKARSMLANAQRKRSRPLVMPAAF